MNRNILRGLALVGAVVSATAAKAALPAGVADAITSAQTDGVTAVGLLAAMGASVFLIKKVLSKLGII